MSNYKYRGDYVCLSMKDAFNDKGDIVGKSCKVGRVIIIDK